MKHLMNTTRVLVASDTTEDAHLVQRQLKAHFSHVQVSTDAGSCLEDFERHAPEVLVLAFDRLDKARRYYHGLYRLGGGLPQRPHRTVILCSQDDVHAVFDLCKQACFDDYVLYWPHSQDGLRLVMSVWNAGRATTTRLAMSVWKASRATSVPQRLPPTPSGLQVRQPVEPGRRARPLVMVFDDDAFVHRLVDRVLDPLEWETTFAVDGNTALAHLDRHRPDVILMDIHLPGLGGVALTQRLKASPPLAGIPVIMMTGDASKSTLAHSMEAGVASFVVKPFTRESLTSKLEAALAPLA